ncbi:MAG: MoxR family ATPase, partial [Planctomycetota bacterium]
PEAQLDRFLFKLVVGYPSESDYKEILRRTTGGADVDLKAVSKGKTINKLRKIVRSVPVPEHVEDHAVRMVMGTQPNSRYAPGLVNRFVALGSSPRGAQALLLGGKVKALLAGRFSVAVEDLQAVALPVLRHRVLLNFEGLSEGVTPERIVEEVQRSVESSSSAHA